MTQPKFKNIYQFRIELYGTEPKIWRVIQVPQDYSFWDLHVAIQDAMGWLDYHLHVFSPKRNHSNRSIEIGIPESYEPTRIIPGWEIPITDLLVEPGEKIYYNYDFGDDWMHEVLLEGILMRDRTLKYPRCIAGERACPPEDCGGLPGYYNLLEILADPKHPEHKFQNEWLRNHAKNYLPYNPDAFDPAAVKFWNPKKRFKMSFPSDY